MMQSQSAIDGLRGKSYGVEHILSSEAGPLSQVLEKSLHLPAPRTEFLLQLGAIYRNNARIENEADLEIQTGDYLRVHQNPRRFPVEVLNVRKSIVWENKDLVIINKPSGLPVHPTVDNTQENVVALFEKEFSQNFYVTHRLDVATQGLLVLAKNKPAQSLMNTKLMKNEVTKHYRAQVSPAKTSVGLPLGEIVHYMEPSPRAPKKLSPVELYGWQQCRLRILNQQTLENGMLLAIIELITGRTHQIRAQLSALGFPILGDVAYGSPHTFAAFEKIALQAFSISFEWENELICLQLPDFQI